MRKKILSLVLMLSITLSVFVPVSTVYADDWILASNLPAGTEVTARKWTYTQTYYTTSSSSSLSGWEKYNTTEAWGPWGSWSSWSDTKRTASDSRQVETKKVDDRYVYYRYAASKDASTGSYKKSTSYPNKYTYNLDSKLTQKSSTSTNPQSYKYYYNGTNYHSLWEDDPFRTQKTQYRYRDRSKVYTYYYRRSENKESSSYPSGDNLSNITEWVQYKYKSFTLDLNGWLDGQYSGGIAGYGTADVYINGNLVANDVNDFYNTYVYGTTFTITDVKSIYGHSYNGVYSGPASGTITGNVSTILNFSTNTYTRYVISEDENKGTTTGTGTYTYGTNAEVKAIPKSGYSFSQWDDGSTENPRTIAVTGAATYIAYFTPNSYNVTFDANGGNVSLQSKSVTYNGLYGELPIPNRDGFSFDGWFTFTVGGTKIDSNTTVLTANNHILYAQWSETNHHFSDWVVDRQATCEEEGSQHRDCGDCGFVETVTIPPTGHQYSSEWSIVKSPTCTTEGEKAHVCSVCGSQTDNTPIEMTVHNYGEWEITKEPTCEAKGSKKRICTDCGAVDTKEISATGHSYSDEWTVIKEPTCTVEGEKAHVCSVCGAMKDNTSVEKKEHSYSEWETLIEPDCTESGIEYRNCLDCGRMNSRRVKSTGHQFGDDWVILKRPTCNTTGEKVQVCKICGEQSEVTIMERTEHEYGEWESEIEASCTDDGIEYRECALCGKKEKRVTSAKGHSYCVDHIIREPKEETPGVLLPGVRYMVCENGCGDSYAEEYYPEIQEGNIVTAQIGEMDDNLVRVSVTLKQNPGFSRFAINVNYDKNVFTPKSISAGSSLNSNYFDSNLKKVQEGVWDLADIDRITATYSNNAQNIDIEDENAELFEIVFELNSDVPTGEYTITTTYTGSNGFQSSDGISPSLGIFDNRGNQIMPQVSDAVLKVEVKNIKGDVNQDHRVDILDCMYLGWKMVNWRDLPWSEAHRQAADVFTDGRITPKDGTRLAQIVAGYDLTKIKTFSLPKDDISLFALTNDYITFNVENVVGIAGTEVDVPIIIKGNTGISGFNFKVTYDKKYLTPVSVINGDFQDITIISNLQQKSISASTLDSINVCSINDNNIVGDGVLLTVRFFVNRNVEDGQIIPITLTYTDGAVCKIKDTDIEDVNISVKQGSVETIIDPSVLLYPFELYEIVMSASDGTEIDSIPQNEDFDLEVRLRKLKDYSEQATLFIATYNELNSLTTIKTVELTDKIINRGFCDVHIEKMNNSISSMKVFIWNSLSNMSPLAENYTIN